MIHANFDEVEINFGRKYITNYISIIFKFPIDWELVRSECPMVKGGSK
jgi:hypothetical protein